jgi:hypothetical protein
MCALFLEGEFTVETPSRRGRIDRSLCQLEDAGYTGDSKQIGGAGVRPGMYGIRIQGMQGQVTFCLPGGRHDEGQEAECHAAHSQLVRIPDAARQNSDEALAGEKERA